MSAQVGQAGDRPLDRAPGRVVVLGAGVVGLTCAVRLAEAGHRVDVLARDLPLETTSVVAAAIWYPYLAEPRDRVVGWGATSYAAFAALAADQAPDVHGVRMVPGTEVLGAPTPDPWWASAVPDLTREPPPPGWADAWTFTAPVVDMPVYLAWLRRRLEALGGTLTRASLGGLGDLGDLGGRAPARDPGGAASDDRVGDREGDRAGDRVVVDCAGLGARLLAHDLTVRPVRGQVVVLDGVRLDRWTLDGSGPTYVVPRLGEVVVGGTEQAGDWSRTPSPETATEILQRATRLVPELAAGRVVAHRVGLRPVRPTIRLEVEGRVVHCYGHGGAGVTLSWGCADEVVARVESLVRA